MSDQFGQTYFLRSANRRHRIGSRWLCLRCWLELIHR